MQKSLDNAILSSEHQIKLIKSLKNILKSLHLMPKHGTIQSSVKTLLFNLQKIKKTLLTRDV